MCAHMRTFGIEIVFLMYPDIIDNSYMAIEKAEIYKDMVRQI